MSASTARIATEKGDLTVELHPDTAPNTVDNFTSLAEDGFYDGLRFHRVIDDFVVQAGCPHSREKGNPKAGTGGPGYTIDCELDDDPHPHEKGTLSMAHAGRDTGGSQFFICLGRQPHLDGEHTVFGQVTDGLDVLDEIEVWDRIETIQTKDA